MINKPYDANRIFLKKSPMGRVLSIIHEFIKINPQASGINFGRLFPLLSGTLLCLSIIPIKGYAEDVFPEPSVPQTVDEGLNLNFDDPNLIVDDIISEELLLFEELPVVVSASRSEQPINQSSVPISIISDKDIRASGATNLYEIIQFQPGIDMLQIDRNRYALGVRGLHEFFSDRTLTLVDGRIADSPIFGGSELLRLPIFLDDIERVEVVRGPGGAAWGANAINGVINIITKDPEQTHGSNISGTINEFGDHYTQLRWGEGIGKWDWRLSLGYQDWESSDDAIEGDNFASRDFHRDIRFDGNAVYRLNEESKLSFGLGTSHIEQGDFEVANAQPGENSHLTTIRGYTKLDHTFENDSTGYLQWFGNFAKTEWPGLQTNDSLENALEGQYNFTISETHDMVVGGNLRLTRITTDLSSPEDVIFNDEPLTEEWAGVFLLDRWHANDRWVLETQIRGDYYSETQSDWAGRLTSLISLDDESRHILRLSGARAFRTPLAGFNEMENNRFLLFSRITPPDDLDNEGIISLELGYTGQINRFITFKCNSYYQRYSDLIGLKTISQTFIDINGDGIPDVPSTVLTWENVDDAEALGVEVELTMNSHFGNVSLWYAYNDFSPDRSNQAVRALLPARNKAGVTSRVFLPWELTLNINYKYTDFTSNNPGALPIVPDQFEISHRLDITISKKFFDERFEWLAGVSDLLDDTDIPVFGINNFTAHETPGRIFFSRLSFKF